MNFSAKEIVTIIKAISGSRVTSVEMEGLKIECDSTGQAYPVEQDLGRVKTPLDYPQEARLKEIIQEELVSDPQFLELQRQTLMIEDPLEFEKMMDREADDA